MSALCSSRKYTGKRIFLGVLLPFAKDTLCMLMYNNILIKAPYSP